MWGGGELISGFNVKGEHYCVPHSEMDIIKLCHSYPGSTKLDLIGEETSLGLVEATTV